MMRKLLRLAAIALPLALLTAEASAQNLVRYDTRGTVLATTACDGTLTTSSIYVEGFSTLTLSWVLTDANSSVTEVTATCVGTGPGNSDATTTYRVPVIVGSSATGVVSYAQYQYSYATTAAVNSQFAVGITGNRYVKCTFACGGANADTIAVVGTVTNP